MTGQSRIRRSLSIAGATCFTALALLAVGTPGAADASGDRGNCDLYGWSGFLAGHWGGDCR